MVEASDETIKHVANLLNADAVMSQEVAAELSFIAGNLRSKYPDYFEALSIGGSCVNGGAVAKSIIQNIEPKKAISDIDYGVILSRPITETDRKFLHKDITAQLNQIGFAPCSTFNAENVFLVIDEPYNMVRRMLDIKKNKGADGISHLATRLLMPFGVIFPFSDRREMQNMVKESLDELTQKDSEFAKQLKEEMNRILQQRRKIKGKHVPDHDIQKYLDINRAQAETHF